MLLVTQSPLFCPCPGGPVSQTAPALTRTHTCAHTGTHSHAEALCVGLAPSLRGPGVSPVVGCFIILCFWGKSAKKACSQVSTGMPSLWLSALGPKGAPSSCVSPARAATRLKSASQTGAAGSRPAGAYILLWHRRGRPWCS